MSDAFSFQNLMDASANLIPEKRKIGEGRYKFRCTTSRYESDFTHNDGTPGMRFLLSLKPVQNLNNADDDVDNIDNVIASWTDKSPSFATEDLAAFIKAHNFTCPFKEAAPELVGRFYTGAIIVDKKGYTNLRGLRPVE